MSTMRERDEKALKEAMRDLNNAVYRVMTAGKDTTLFPNLNRQALREMARTTDEMFEEAPWRSS
jgi:ElaB/YqjD/DUF883 family membrane-anchored ribosome-binding protein